MVWPVLKYTTGDNYRLLYHSVSSWINPCENLDNNKWMYWEALLQCVETMKRDIKVNGNKNTGSHVDCSLPQPSKWSCVH